MFFTVYLTTNLLNGRYYIGSHKTENPNDDYLGSGKAILRAIKKHGRENFRKEIIFMAFDEEKMKEIEFELVVPHDIDKNSYNILVGGGRPPILRGDQHPNYGGFKWITDGKEDKHIKNDDVVPMGWKLGRKNGTKKGKENVFFGTNYSKDKFWITDGVENRYIKKTETIPLNFYRGRSVVFVTDGVKDRIIKKNELLPEGYRYGKKKRNAVEGVAHG